MYHSITIKESPEKMSIKNLALNIGVPSKQDILKYTPKLKQNNLKINSEVYKKNVEIAFKLSSHHPSLSSNNIFKSLPSQIQSNSSPPQKLQRTPLSIVCRPNKKKFDKHMGNSLQKRGKQSNYKFFPKRSSPKKNTLSPKRNILIKREASEELISLKYWRLEEHQQFLRLYTGSCKNTKEQSRFKNRVKSSVGGQKTDKMVDKQIDLSPWGIHKQQQQF